MTTPEDIKKGLECCHNEVACECENCPYSMEGGETLNCDFLLGEDALAYIQQLESRVPRWIPVEERLPEEKSLVLIYWIDHIFEATYLWDGNFETLYKELLLAGRDFTHWMPLPEPPKEEHHE